MRIAINAICIEDNSILLLKKKDVWILPGGKPKEGESDLECLDRENLEELPKAQISINDHYGDFEGKTPHTGDMLLSKVYFGKVQGDATPSAEISESRYFKKEEFHLIPISEITRKVLDALVSEGRL